MTSPAEETSRRLLDAEASAAPIPPIAEQVGVGDIDAAYEVQRASVATWTSAGRRVIGRKIGLTNTRVQVQLGVDRPDFGVLFEDMRYESGMTVPYRRVLQPRIEAEMAFVIGRPLDDPAATKDDVAGAVTAVHAALEIVGSRIADWKISIVDTIADNASSGAFVMGRPGVLLDAVDLTGASMEMTRMRGAKQEVVSRGAGLDCLGSPLLAAHWLAVELAHRGDPLQPGDVILTGALGPMVPVEPGDCYDATISGLGSVSVTFTA